MEWDQDGLCLGILVEALGVRDELKFGASVVGLVNQSPCRPPHYKIYISTNSQRSTLRNVNEAPVASVAALEILR